MAMAYAGGVVLGADSRTSTGNYIANRASDKITCVADNVWMCRSGSVSAGPCRVCVCVPTPRLGGPLLTSEVSVGHCVPVESRIARAGIGGAPLPFFLPQTNTPRRVRLMLLLLSKGHSEMLTLKQITFYQSYKRATRGNPFLLCHLFLLSRL